VLPSARAHRYGGSPLPFAASAGLLIGVAALVSVARPHHPATRHRLTITSRRDSTTHLLFPQQRLASEFIHALDRMIGDQ